MNAFDPVGTLGYQPPFLLSLLSLDSFSVRDIILHSLLPCLCFRVFLFPALHSFMLYLSHSSDPVPPSQNNFHWLLTACIAKVKVFNELLYNFCSGVIMDFLVIPLMTLILQISTPVTRLHAPQCSYPMEHAFSLLIKTVMLPGSTWLSLLHKSCLDAPGDDTVSSPGVLKGLCFCLLKHLFYFPFC